jgi:hypothetical protein
MARNPLRRILCLFGRHKRSRGKAHDSGLDLMSVCRHCGVGMRRIRGKWTVDRGERA